MDKLEKLDGRVTKILDSKMDNFFELGMDDGGSIYVEKEVFRHTFKAGDNGTFTYHRALWGRNKREVRILDGFVHPLPPIVPQAQKVDATAPTGQNLQVQQIHNEDFMEIQRRTEQSSGKTEDRKTTIKLDTVRVYGDLNNEEAMKEKIKKFRRIVEWFDTGK